VREVVAELGQRAWALAALSAAVEAGLLVALAETGDVDELGERTGMAPALVERLLDVLVALELVHRGEDGRYAPDAQLAALTAPPGLEPLRAELRTTALQAADLTTRARAGKLSVGWEHTDPVLLEAQGAVSAGAVELLETVVFPRLGGPPARFLDVGAGVGTISIALCRRHPGLHAVALEPQAAPLALLHRHVAEAGLHERVTIRQQPVEALTEVEVHDLAWLPLNFLLPGIPPVALATVHRALRPGGWLVCATMGSERTDLPATIARLQATLWGSDGYTPARVEEMLVQAGYVDVASLPPTPSGLTALFARRS